jgi:hypothetical protein
MIDPIGKVVPYSTSYDTDRNTILIINSFIETYLHTLLVFSSIIIRASLCQKY